MRGPLTGKFFFDPKEERVGIILSMSNETTNYYHLGYGIPYEDDWESRWVRKLRMLDFRLFDTENELIEYLEMQHLKYLEKIYPEYCQRQNWKGK